MFISSLQIPVRHGFCVRKAENDAGGFSSLNFGSLGADHGLSTRDDSARVKENEQLLASALGTCRSRLMYVKQVHGNSILEADSPKYELMPNEPLVLGEADGMISRARNLVLCIRTADCVPILIYAPDVEAIGAVHAGWKGSRLVIVKKAVEEMVKRYDASPKKMIAAIGPAIGSCCYQVGDDIAGSFKAMFGSGVVFQRNQKLYIDLAEINRITLLESGMNSERIDVLKRCTCCEPELFFSYRRDHGHTGRHISFIVLDGDDGD
jgi:hypothetical protein